MKRNNQLLKFLLFIPSALPFFQIKGQDLLQRSSILFYENIPYATETRFITPNAHKHYDRIQILKLPGIRLHTMQFNGRMSRKMFRVLFKTNHCLRAEADYKYTIICSVTLKLLMKQSWVKAWSSGSFAKAIMTVSGPGFDGSNLSTASLHQQIVPIINGLKKATISQSELNEMKNNFISNAEATLNRTPEYVAKKMMDRLVATPITADLLQMNEYPNIRGIPSQALDKMHTKTITLKDCQIMIATCLRSPLEIFLMDKTVPQAGELIDAMKPLWETFKPDTRYKLSQSDSGFTNKGKTVLVSCQGGSIKDMAPVLSINLGKLTPVSLIAADIICTQFDSYANTSSPLLEINPSYHCVWAPCGGCALVMIRFSNFSPTMSNQINYLGAIQIAFHNFREKISRNDIENYLLTSWLTSMGINQKERDLDVWTKSSPSKAIGYMDWMIDLYGFENVFYDLNALMSEQNDQNLMHTLYQDVYNLIQERLLERANCFDIWLFRGV